MKKLCLLFLVVCFCSGCAAIAKQSLPTVLTSKDQMWTIPAGTPFKAIQKPAFPTLTEFVVTEDLAVLHKGNLLELEEEANRRAVKQAKDARNKGLMWGGLASVLTIVAAVVKGLMNKKK